jgi:hypothetical protein
MSSDESEALLHLMVGCIVGAVLFWRGFIVRRKKKLIENIPTSKVRSVALGLVEVKGQAVTCQAVHVTPFAEIECVYYAYHVREHRGSGKHSRWVTIAQEASHTPFYLEDDTGKIRINPDGAQTHLQVDRTYGTGSFRGEDAATLIAGLKRLGHETQGLFRFHRTFECTETYIEPGDTLYVMGTAQDNPAVSGSEVGAENICIADGDDGFFVISDKSEEALVGSLLWKVYLYLYGGPALSLGCLTAIVMGWYTSQ